MKKLLMITALLIGTFSSSVYAQKAAHFGAKINEKGAIGPSELIKAMEGRESLDVKVEAKIAAVCQKKGCWMDLDLENGQTMKVRFKDYEFFVPKDADGKMAIVDGSAKIETIDVETLRHYAEDAGKSADEVAAITEPERGYSFEAVGVIIK